MEDWNEENTLLPIRLYEEKENLWNPKNKDYKKTNLKLDSWDQIGEAMGITGEICKIKMVSVLLSNRREKAKERNSQGTGKGNKLIKCNIQTI
ncbi:Alcohol dehydrogenase transcription factor Myb/SANT-like [Popillia japonica]|uniref:Alcohol dehydrogenase transcription factor Myb/SANT-like n=1 Tax=Popillia japonica TaxID=7064 RepID=A0AAW1IWY1_POPJA